MKKLMKFALMVGGIALGAKVVAAKKSQWRGLTESEVRMKLDARLPDRVPEEKRAAVADQVISKMRERGVLRDEGEALAHTDNGGVGKGQASGPAEDVPGDSTESTEI